jgi:hypothetical protein
METNTWTYYINGASRVAKVVPEVTQQPSKNQGLDPLLRNSSFYISDHLGNTRVVYDIYARSKGYSEIIEEMPNDFANRTGFMTYKEHPNRRLTKYQL